jgi:hypothetical protein
LPNILVNVSLVSIQEMLGEYFKSGKFKKETQKGFLALLEFQY